MGSAPAARRTTPSTKLSPTVRVPSLTLLVGVLPGTTPARTSHERARVLVPSRRAPVGRRWSSARDEQQAATELAPARRCRGCVRRHRATDVGGRRDCRAGRDGDGGDRRLLAPRHEARARVRARRARGPGSQRRSMGQTQARRVKPGLAGRPRPQERMMQGRQTGDRRSRPPASRREGSDATTRRRRTERTGPRRERRALVEDRQTRRRIERE